MPDNQNKEDRLTLDLLDAIEQKDDVSQRHLAEQMGVALGMANSYLKRCVKKGWVKMTTAPANRYLYYLTPTGFAEKARLTGEFLTTSLALVRQSGEAYNQFFQSIAENNKAIVFIGLSDLTEMAYLRAMHLNIDVLGIYCPELPIDSIEFPQTQLPDQWFNIPVSTTIKDEWQQAVFIFTALENGIQTVQLIKELHPDQELYIPEFLSLTTSSVTNDKVQAEEEVVSKAVNL